MAEEKKNRSEELESLDKKINEIINGWNQNPEEIVEFLQFSSKFSYAYSPRNMMLIAQQQRGALLCKSFKAWKELGYSVKKGEHHRLSLYKNSELFSHHTFQNNQKNAESLFCVS